MIPNLSKCGGTKRDPYIKCKELFNMSLPTECEVEYFIKVSDWKKIVKVKVKYLLNYHNIKFSRARGKISHTIIYHCVCGNIEL